MRRAAIGDRHNTATLSATLAGDDYVEKAEVALPLPLERDLVVAVRGRAGSVLGMVGEDGWVRASRTARSARDGTVAETATSLLSITGQSARVTAWQLGLINLSGEAPEQTHKATASWPGPLPWRHCSPASPQQHRFRVRPA
jgi:hypothetical protein